MRWRSIILAMLLVPFGGGIPALLAGPLAWPGRPPPTEDEKAREKLGGEFLDPETTWATILADSQVFLARFPSSRYTAEVQGWAPDLRTAIAEEATHHPKPLDQMTPAEQAVEDVYQLRYLNDPQWVLYQKYPLIQYGPGGHGEVITPVHRLVDLGDAGIPALIDALDDSHLTRSSMNSLSIHGGPISLMRVSDVAMMTLDFIAGRNFYPIRGNDGKLLHGTSREQAEAWWAERQSLGEKQQLLAQAGQRGPDGEDAVRLVVRKYPDVALAAIQAQMPVAVNDAVRGSMVDLIAQLPAAEQEAATGFLEATLLPGAGGVPAQAAAARILAARGRPEAVSSAIQAWQAIQPRLTANRDDAYDDVAPIINFLAKSGDASALEALGQEASRSPVDVRLAVVRVFLPPAKRGGSEFGSGRTVSLDASSDESDRVGTKPSDAALEKLLAGFLGDTERRFGISGERDGVSYNDPRVCDFAALVMSLRWPEKYAFHWTADTTACDVQIAAIRDHWRAESGLPPGPAAKRVAVITPAKDSDVAPLLDDFASAGSPEERAAAVAKIEQLFGLGALPAVRARYQETKKVDWYELAVALASEVREVRAVDDASDGAVKLAKALVAGRSLSGDVFLQVLVGLSALPPEMRGATMVVQRNGDGTGFVITVGWLPGKLPGQDSWNRHLNVLLRNKSLANGAESDALNALKPEAIYGRYAQAFERAQQWEIDGPVYASLRITRGVMREGE